MKRYLVFFLLIAVVLTACTSQKPKPEDIETASAGDASDTVIVYSRGGGLQGKSETWTIYPDGRVFSSNGKDWTVEASQVEAVLAKMDEVDFYSKLGNYATLSQCRDCFQYTITVEKGDLAYTVTTEDADTDTPPEIWEIIDLINPIITPN